MSSVQPSMSGCHTNITTWLQLIRAEYLEIPGLCLTQSQAERFWRLDTLTCEALLSALTDVKFLRRTDRGAYVRAAFD